MLIFLRVCRLSKIQGLIVLIIQTAAAGKTRTKTQVMAQDNSQVTIENCSSGGSFKVYHQFDFITVTD